MDKRDKTKVVYYPGCSANFWEPEVGIATVALLERNGFEVIVPKLRCCGIARIGYGDLAGAHREAESLISELAAVGGGDYDIITSCPSCSSAINDRYSHLLNMETGSFPINKTYFISEYLSRLYETGELDTNFKRLVMSVSYHSPCHLAAQGLDHVSVDIMKLVPGLRVSILDRVCCGMFGSRGFKKQYYDSSMMIGKALFENITEEKADLVATDCSGCKLQIEQATRMKVIHPVVILDNAYNGRACI